MYGIILYFSLISDEICQYKWGMVGRERDRFVKLNLGGTNLLVSALPEVLNLWLESVVLALENNIKLKFKVLQLESLICDWLYCYLENYIR